MTNRSTRRMFLRMSATGLSILAIRPFRATAADGDAAQLLNAAAKAMAALKTFHFEMETVDGKSTILENLELQKVEGDVLRPDSFRATLTAKVAVAKVSVDVISVGGAVWVTDPLQAGTVWRQVAGDGEQNIGAAFTDLINPDRLFLAAISLIGDPQIEGNEKVDGVDCTVVTGQFDPKRLSDLASPTAGGLGTPVEGEVNTPSILTGEPVYLTAWIADDGRVMRIEEEGPLTTSESNDVVRRITFSKFDEPIEITAPQ
ncbi:MAG TPA: LppX_LprAFG lipoprotein [Thermomicrobiales bacterium]|nr:LppX_LprAFG lipoprotein [Thermomicrobiales bacterium]